jgi:glycosyltransferase involved in cell wall biosynthesis
MNFERFIHLSAPDIIYTAGSEAGYVMACLRSKGIGITWMHTNFATLSVRRVQVDGWELCTALEEPIGKRELACLAGCDLVLALSETDKQEITSVFGIPNSKVIVAPPGVDPYIFFPSSGFPAMPIVVSAGRMSAIKDYPFLLKAFSHTVRSSRRQDVQLTIIGGNNRERSDLGIPQLIRNMGLAKHVRLIDGVSQSRLAELFRQSRVFAGTSKHETFGLLPVEARACGLPFVVRRNSGYMATAVDGQGGYLADNIDPVDMGQRIDRILSLDEASWLELSRQAIKSSARFRYSEMARIFKEACKQCM